jgi:hypothetical protein
MRNLRRCGPQQRRIWARTGPRRHTQVECGRFFSFIRVIDPSPGCHGMVYNERRMRAPHPPFDPAAAPAWPVDVAATPSLDPTWLAQQPYTAFFCEENVWRLCCDTALQPRAWALIITNTRRTVAMWSQRATNIDPIVWDYHVVTVVAVAVTAALINDATSVGDVVVLDQDCRAGTVLPLQRWLMTSFRAGLSVDVSPRFRMVPAADYATSFASDRRHMLDHEGAPLQPLPPWPAPNAERGSSLARILDLDDASVGNADHLQGEVLDLEGLARRFGLKDLQLPPISLEP